jgi:tRNA pseudouridine13 synthase
VIPGIDGFFSKKEGIGGKIKEAPEDFIVEEISPEGEVFEKDKEIKFKEGSGDYTHFILEKKDWDTHRIIKEISRRLRVSKKRMGFAGTKDKRAITVQRMSVWKIGPEQIKEVRIKDAVLRPLCYSDHSVELGELSGNRFTVAITDIEPKPKECKKRVLAIWKELKNGMPYFFGEQRFGTARPITHHIGKELIDGNMEQAVRDYIYKVYSHRAFDKISQRLDRGNEKASEVSPAHVYPCISVISI